MISVQRSLSRVKGVVKADVSLEAQEAVVTFDDAKTDVQTLLKATSVAGYPSRLKQGAK